MTRSNLSVIRRLFGTREIQEWLLVEGTRCQIIDWLIWNDGNGVYSDEDCDAEDYPRLELATARETMQRVLDTI